jgi:hypothetical protein
MTSDEAKALFNGMRKIELGVKNTLYKVLYAHY